MRAKKGLRKIVVDSITYYWNVSEETDFYAKRLIVLDERGSCVLTRRYSPGDIVSESHLMNTDGQSFIFSWSVQIVWKRL